MKKVNLFLSIFLSFQIAPAFGEAFDGHTLSKFCSHIDNDSSLLSDVEISNYMFCLGMVNGIDTSRQGHLQIFGRTLYCPPVNFVAKQGVRTFNKYISKHPEKLHRIGSETMFKSFIQAYPCNSSKT